MTFYHGFSLSASVHEDLLTQSSTEKTLLEQVRTTVCIGMIPQLWDDVADGDDDGDRECLHF